MNDFNLFKRSELSYILNNEKIFGKQIIQRIEEYCKRNKFFAKHIRKEYAEWDEFNHLNFNRSDDKILIKWSKQAYKAESFEQLITISGVSILLIFALIKSITTKIYDTEFYWGLFLVPISAMILSFLFLKKYNTKIKSTQNSYLEISNDSTVRFLADGALLVEDKIRSVNIFWEYGSEGSRHIIATLELGIGESRKIVVYSSVHYLEQFRIGNEICKFLGLDIRLFNGKSPKVDKIEL